MHLHAKVHCADIDSTLTIQNRIYVSMAFMMEHGPKNLIIYLHHEVGESFCVSGGLAQ